MTEAAAGAATPLRFPGADQLRPEDLRHLGLVAACIPGDSFGFRVSIPMVPAQVSAALGPEAPGPGDLATALHVFSADELADASDTNREDAIARKEAARRRVGRMLAHVRDACAGVEALLRDAAGVDERELFNAVGERTVE